MAKIIIDINQEDQYLLAIKKDTNHPMAYGGPYLTKGMCMHSVALFREYAKDGVLWHFLQDVDGFYYAEWRMHDVIITTKKGKLYRYVSNLVDTIKREVNFGTGVLHTTIHNTNYATRKV